MACFRNNYTLYSRNRSHGGKIWYYRTYTPDGVRTSGKSTGCTSKIAAKLFCEDLLKRGLLWSSSIQIFGQFANDWFGDGKPWLTDKLSCSSDDIHSISDGYIRQLRNYFSVHIYPYWKNVKLEDIRPSRVKVFRSYLLGQNLAPKAVNNILKK